MKYTTRYVCASESLVEQKYQQTLREGIGQPKTLPETMTAGVHVGEIEIQANACTNARIMMDCRLGEFNNYMCSRVTGILCSKPNSHPGFEEDLFCPESAIHSCTSCQCMCICLSYAVDSCTNGRIVHFFLLFYGWGGVDKKVVHTRWG